MDGVLTQTASVHAAAWQQMFDEYLRERAERTASRSCRSTSRATTPSTSTAGSAATARGPSSGHGASPCRRAHRTTTAPQETVNGLSNRKNALVVEHIRTDGVDVFPGSWRYLQRGEDAGLRVGVVSASANTPEVLRVTGLDQLIGARIDGADRRP